MTQSDDAPPERRINARELLPQLRAYSRIFWPAVWLDVSGVGCDAWIVSRGWRLWGGL
jgi:hypothetical protein